MALVENVSMTFHSLRLKAKLTEETWLRGTLAASFGAVLLGVYTPATGLCTGGFSTQALLVLPDGKPLP